MNTIKSLQLFTANSLPLSCYRRVPSSRNHKFQQEPKTDGGQREKQELSLLFAPFSDNMYT